MRKPGLDAVGESVCWSSFCLSRKPCSTHLALHFKKFPSLSLLTVRTQRPLTKFLHLTLRRSTSSKTSLSTQDLYSSCLALAKSLENCRTSVVVASFRERSGLLADVALAANPLTRNLVRDRSKSVNWARTLSSTFSSSVKSTCSLGRDGLDM